MTMIEYVIHRILELCSQRDLSINGLAHIAGIPPTTIKNILNGSSMNPGVVTLKKICDGLDISMIDFFDTEEYRKLEQEIR